MTATFAQYFAPNEIAILRRTGEAVKVGRTLRKNVEWQDRNGKLWRGDALLLDKAPEGTEFEFSNPDVAEAVTWDHGVVVRFLPDTKGYRDNGDQLFVVLKGDGNKHQLAWLGGHPTRRGLRYTGVHSSQLEKVEL